MEQEKLSMNAALVIFTLVFTGSTESRYRSKTDPLTDSGLNTQFAVVL